MTYTKVLEVSNIETSAEKTTFIATRYDKFDEPTGLRIQWRSYSEETVLDGENNPVQGELTQDEVLAYAKSRIIEEQVDEVVYSETQTLDNNTTN